VQGSGTYDHGFSGTYSEVARVFASKFKREELGIADD
jgi:hypothetical protein